MFRRLALALSWLLVVTLPLVAQEWPLHFAEYSIEVVKAVISGNEADRQKCWREHKLGSTIPKTRCATIAEIQQIREGAEQWKGEPSICGNMGDAMDCGGNARDSVGSQ